MKRILAVLLTSVLLFSLAGCGAGGKAGELPKNIELQVPAKAGGGTDVMARTVAAQISKDSGANVTIINNTDGGGVVAMETIRNAKPDGSKLLFFHTTMLIKKATGVYDKSATEDFTVIGAAVSSEKGGYMLVVRSDSGIETLEDLIAKAKEKPGELLFGVETGGSAHIMTGMFAKETGIDIKYVEAGSDTDKLTALVGGSIDAAFVNPNQASQYREAGKVKVLGCFSSDEEGGRSSVLPDVPSFIEQGYDLQFATIVFILGPKGMDEALVQKLYDHFSEAAKHDDVNAVLKPAGMDLIFFSREEGIERLKAQEKVINEVVKDLGLDK
jgi:putative tricarboxylic transport membrane protein